MNLMITEILHFIDSLFVFQKQAWHVQHHSCFLAAIFKVNWTMLLGCTRISLFTYLSYESTGPYAWVMLRYKSKNFTQQILTKIYNEPSCLILCYSQSRHLWARTSTKITQNLHWALKTTWVFSVKRPVWDHYLFTLLKLFVTLLKILCSPKAVCVAVSWIIIQPVCCTTDIEIQLACS